MERMLVTGGAGFIGSHTCLQLLNKGYEVIVIDSLINSSKESIKRVNKLSNKKNKLIFYEGDLKDINFLDKIFTESNESKKNIKSVMHFAGLKSVKESIVNPLLYWENNVQGTQNLLKIMNNNNCRTIVFSSSATVYGSSEKSIIDENSDINPINPYGTTKMVVEFLLRDIFTNSIEKWKVACLRYFNPIGAHESGEIGEDPLGIANNIFPTLTRVAKGEVNKLKIFGNDWPTEDGTCIRDYIHVMDLADGHIAALEYLRHQNKFFKVINLGTGKGSSVMQLLKIFQDVNHININFSFAPRRHGDVSRLVADNSQALKILNWKPERTIEQMCRDGWKWQQNNPRGYR